MHRFQFPASQRHQEWGWCQVGLVPLPLCQCHGKSKALIFVLDCSSPIFTTGNFLGIFVPISSGGRREWGGGRRLSQQLERELGTSLGQHDPFSLKHRHSHSAPTNSLHFCARGPGSRNGYGSALVVLTSASWLFLPRIDPQLLGLQPIPVTPGDNGCPALLHPLGSSGFYLPQDSVRSL